MNKKWSWALLGLLIIISMVLSACQPEKVIQTVVITQEVMKEGTAQVIEKVITATPEPTQAPTPVPAKASPDNRADVVRLAMLSDLDGLNVWYYYDINGSSYWSTVVMNFYYPTLYAISDQRWDWVPYIADGMPADIVKEGDFYVGVAKLKKDLKWSDGSPLTSADVAFTANTALLFSLSGNWVGYYNPAVLDRVEAPDPLTVKYYFKISPGLPVWQYGTLIGPVVNKAYWEAKVASVIEKAKQLDPKSETFLTDITPLQTELEAIDPTGEPIYGPMKLNKWEQGAFAENIVNENSFTIGMTVNEYTNGAYQEQHKNPGYDYTIYGNAEGDKSLQVVYGPYFNTMIYPVYSQDAAYLALQNKEVDIVLNPSGVSSGVRDQLSGDPNIELVKNAQNGFRYIEFNQAKTYFNGDAGMALRQAVACQIDLDFLANNVLQRQVEPVYTLVPPGLTYWHNKDVPIYCQGKTPQERIEESVKMLKAAGFTWEKEPSFNAGDARTAGVVYGEGIKMPDGAKIPEITMQAPGPGYDPLRATSGVYIEQWMRQLGIPVTTVYTPFNTIRANENSGAFDIIMLGWGLTSFPSYLCDFFTGATGAGDGSDNIAYVSPKLNEKCGQFYAANKLEDARAIAFELQTILATELPYITLFTNPIYDAYQSSIAYPYTKVFDGLQGIYGAANLVMPKIQQ